jgi:hypothetical protein
LGRGTGESKGGRGGCEGGDENPAICHGAYPGSKHHASGRRRTSRRYVHALETRRSTMLQPRKRASALRQARRALFLAWQ